MAHQIHRVHSRTTAKDRVMKIGDKIKSVYGDRCKVTHIFNGGKLIEVKRIKEKDWMLLRPHEIEE